MLKLSLFLPRAQPPACSNFLGMEAYSLSHSAYLLAGSGGSALYVLRDRGCANRQCDPVADEGEIMLENILPDMGIQEVLAGDQSIDGTKEDPHVFTTQLWGKTFQ
jgi:hypothetical protein